jgi:predicted MFS family arabinose efflux permease
VDNYKNTKRTTKFVIWVIALTVLYLSFYPYNEWWGVTITILYCSFAILIPLVMYLESIDKEG